MKHLLFIYFLLNCFLLSAQEDLIGEPVNPEGQSPLCISLGSSNFNVVIPANSLYSTYGDAIFTNNRIRIDGDFAIDINANITNCEIMLASGTIVTINSGINFSDFDSDWYSCDDAWHGIVATGGSGTSVNIDQSHFEDFEYALTINDYASYQITNNHFESDVDNSVGVYLHDIFFCAPQGSSKLITGNLFQFPSLNRLLFGPGGGTGVLIEESFCVSVGFQFYAPNQFIDCKNGIIRKSSDAWIDNNQFMRNGTSIQYENDLAFPIRPNYVYIGTIQANTFNDVGYGVTADNGNFILVYNNVFNNIGLGAIRIWTSDFVRALNNKFNNIGAGEQYFGGYFSYTRETNSHILHNEITRSFTHMQPYDLIRVREAPTSEVSNNTIFADIHNMEISVHQSPTQ